MNAKPVASAALVRYIELMSLHYSEMGFDPPVANAWSLRAMTREERSEPAAFLGSLMTQLPAKPKSNRIYFNGLGRLALFRDGLPEFLQTLETMEEADRAVKRAEPAAKRRHGKSR